ncbi:MAG: hypothetical protein WCD20_16840 [Rhodomicrobium sp.]
MRSAFLILTLIALFPPRAADAQEVALAGLCLPQTTRFTKCIDGKVAECTRSRNIRCKTRQRCAETQTTCDLPALIR